MKALTFQDVWFWRAAVQVPHFERDFGVAIKPALKSMVPRLEVLGAHTVMDTAYYTVVQVNLIMIPSRWLIVKRKVAIVVITSVTMVVYSLFTQVSGVAII